jgi:hypothetical protein
MPYFSDDIKFFDVLADLVVSEKPLDPVVKKQKENELTEILRGIDRIHIREYFDNEIADWMEKFLKEDNELYQLEDSEIHIDSGIELGLFYPGVYARNYYKLTPPFVRQGVKIPEKMKSLYAESRFCFIFEQFSAAIALSRAIIEFALKTKIGLHEEARDWTAGKTLSKAHDLKIIDDKTYWTASKVINNADKVLHQVKNATDQEALTALDHTKTVLESIFG